MSSACAVPPARELGSRSEGPGRVLVIDDEPLMLRALRRILGADGHEVILAQSVEDAAEPLLDAGLDVVLLDLRLGADSGVELLDRIKRERPDLEVLVMTGHASIESAVGCMRRGALDYLEKPFQDVHGVRAKVRMAVERGRLVRRNRELGSELRGGRGIPELVGDATEMRRLVRTIESLQHNESHVLVQGESGTGKELVARAIHATSPRAQGPFVPVDCGALPESIIESELFGHERGAFTGALGAPGLFRMAERGTLFLDEIGEIPLTVQARLLRALQYKEVRPVGGKAAVSVDIRVVTATHRDLDAMVELKRFRMDLYYRLNVVRVEIPPLRARRSDIPLLAQHFLEKHRRPGGPVEAIDDDALATLVAHDWPGNVRQLENTIESGLALARGPRLRVADLPITRGSRAAYAPRRQAGAPTGSGLPLSLEAYERSALERALREAGGNVVEAARALGIGRSTFYRKLHQHGLAESPGRGTSK